jgi:hypothetical protein
VTDPSPADEQQHPAEPTPDQGPDAGLIAAVAAILLVGAAIVLTAAALSALLRRRGRRVDRRVLVLVLTLTSRGTKPQPRMQGRSDVARAQQRVEAHYRAAYILNAAARIQAAVEAAVRAADVSRGDDVRRVGEEALSAASRRERPYWQAHERARRRRHGRRARGGRRRQHLRRRPGLAHVAGRRDDPGMRRRERHQLSRRHPARHRLAWHTPRWNVPMPTRTAVPWRPLDGRGHRIREEDRMTTRRYRYRSSVTGRYVTADYAAKHPDTTVREEVR